MDMLEIPVTLIVKAPNQQFEDQTVHCSLSWTIKRLKGHLSEVYPSKPSCENQRLIYYGQLLHDSVTLKDVFTRYEADEGTHTVHLVCIPPKDIRQTRSNLKMTEETPERTEEDVNARLTGESTSSSSINEEAQNRSNEGLRQRFVNSGFVNTTNFQPWMNAPENTYDSNLYMQQMAWYQQAYANYYMAQYMDMIQRQNNSGTTDPRQRGMNLEPPRNPEPQPPVQNENDDDDGRGNRDWLDYFYITSRLLVLFSIVYFYSSPARFIIVSALGIILYLYQLGFFRLNPIQALDNNNEVINGNRGQDNNNILPNEEVNAAGAHVEAQEQAQPGAEERVTPNAPVVNEQQEQACLWTVAWTFITTFFSSMIPEAQNAV